MHSTAVAADYVRPTPGAARPVADPLRMITVSIPAPLRQCCGGAADVALPAGDLPELLAGLERRYPELHRSICDETGAVRRHVNLFVNSDNIRDGGGLDSKLGPRDLVTIMTAVSGG